MSRVSIEVEEYRNPTYELLRNWASILETKDDEYECSNCRDSGIIPHSPTSMDICNCKFGISFYNNLTDQYKISQSILRNIVNSKLRKRKGLRNVKIVNKK